MFLSVQDYIDSIRATYTKNFTAKDVSKRQIAVATYLIDKLALRAGNEKVICKILLFLLRVREKKNKVNYQVYMQTLSKQILIFFCVCSV